ncbi:MAG: STAS domain-containing protein [Rhodobacteraceae bacterium]|nr:STAS domain-containing protein [Paracoccaceae bacterium]
MTDRTRTTARLDLPARIDLDGATSLRAALLAHRGAPLDLVARDTVHLGAPGLEVLLSARLLWEQDGHELRIAGASPAFRAGLARLGGAGALPLSPEGNDR